MRLPAFAPNYQQSVWLHTADPIAGRTTKKASAGRPAIQPQQLRQLFHLMQSNRHSKHHYLWTSCCPEGGVGPRPLDPYPLPHQWLI